MTHTQKAVAGVVFFIAFVIAIFVATEGLPVLIRQLPDLPPNWLPEWLEVGLLLLPIVLPIGIAIGWIEDSGTKSAPPPAPRP